MLKTCFPVCASFGPLFIAMGNLFPNRLGPVGLFVAIPGAFMTSAALITIFRALPEKVTEPHSTLTNK